MVKQPTSESSEFTMSSEDFPALPGSQTNDSFSVGENKEGSNIVDTSVSSELVAGMSNRAPGAEKAQAAKKGIQTSVEGKVPH